MEMEIGVFEFVHICLVRLDMEDRLRQSVLRWVLLVSSLQSYGLPVWSVFFDLMMTALSSLVQFQRNVAECICLAIAHHQKEFQMGHLVLSFYSP